MAENSQDQPGKFPARIENRAERSRTWLKYYERITILIDRFRVGLAQITDEPDFPPQMQAEVLSLLAELMAYKQVAEERKRGLAYLAEGRTENDPPADPKKIGTHLKFVHALAELIKSIDGEPLPDFRTLPTFRDNYQPRSSPIKADNSFWLWKAERKAYHLRRPELLPAIREARSTLDTQEENLTKFEEMLKALKEDPDLCDV